MDWAEAHYEDDFLKTVLVFRRVDFDEKFITRESNCGHFRPGGLGWGHI